MSYARQHLDEAARILQALDATVIERLVAALADVRARGGRLFFLGVGGSAANAAHAVNDFRKLAGFEAYAPTDNVSELTARVNDEGWETVFVEWLKGSRLRPEDAVFVFSVGGGSLEKNISPNLVRALQYARQIGAAIFGIVGRDGGFTATVADVCVIVPSVRPETVTPHAEAFQAVVWHLLVSHPALRTATPKWESTRRPAAIFLDRDGVLNRAIVRDGKPYPPPSVEQLEILPGVGAALARLKAAGYALVVVSNQPDVKTGRQQREVVEAINAALAAKLPIDEFRVCYHDDRDRCACRKPAPGLLLQAPEYDLARSVIVGDRWRDVEAGRRAGVKAAVLIDYGYDEPCAVEPDLRAPSLSAAADWILALGAEPAGIGA